MCEPTDEIVNSVWGDCEMRGRRDLRVDPRFDSQDAEPHDRNLRQDHNPERVWHSGDWDSGFRVRVSQVSCLKHERASKIRIRVLQ